MFVEASGSEQRWHKHYYSLNLWCRRWPIRDWGDFLTNRRFAFRSSIPITICTRLHGLSLSQTFLFSVPLGEQPAMHPARPRLLSNSFAMPTGLCLTDFTFLPVWFCIFASLWVCPVLCVSVFCSFSLCSSILCSKHLLLTLFKSISRFISLSCHSRAGASEVRVGLKLDA